MSQKKLTSPNRTKAQWERIPWCGDPDADECWVKKFRRGRVYVGIGDFTLVCYSDGANSDDSIIGTRWLYGTIISEEDMMAHIDHHNGRHAPYPVSAEVYRQWWESLSEEAKNGILGVGEGWHSMCVKRHEKMMREGEKG